MQDLDSPKERGARWPSAPWLFTRKTASALPPDELQSTRFSEGGFRYRTRPWHIVKAPPFPEASSRPLNHGVVWFRRTPWSSAPNCFYGGEEARYSRQGALVAVRSATGVGSVVATMLVNDVQAAKSVEL